MKEVDIETAMGFRHPEIVVLVVTRSKESKIDITPIGWAMLGSSNPRTWAIGVAKKHFCHKAILDTKEFTLCIPSWDQRKDVLYCGSVSGWKIEKLPNTKFELLAAKKIKTSLIKDSLACYECKLINKMGTSDHTIFLGEIVNVHISGGKEGLINLGGRIFKKFKRG